jgi:hypothetical protein
VKSIRRLRSIAAYLALLSVLFTQLAVAAYACPGVGGMARSAAAMAMQDMPGCDMAEQDKPTPLCQAHCQQGDQSLDKPASSLQAMAVPCAPPVALAAWNPPAECGPERPLDSLLERPTEPPAAVRHCRLHI